jgi:hypothetical protein
MHRGNRQLCCCRGQSQCSEQLVAFRQQQHGGGGVPAVRGARTRNHTTAVCPFSADANATRRSLCMAQAPQHNTSCSCLARVPPAVPCPAMPPVSPRADDALILRSRALQANLVPFIVETGGRINAAGLQFLSMILLEAEGTAGLTRRHGRAALRGISRALALQQGYMLAQIAEEIHAPDHAHPPPSEARHPPRGTLRRAKRGEPRPSEARTFRRAKRGTLKRGGEILKSIELSAAPRRLTSFQVFTVRELGKNRPSRHMKIAKPILYRLNVESG